MDIGGPWRGTRSFLPLFISETVRKWDPEATSRRIELHVGKDLQWIRINGTIVGGLAGASHLPYLLHLPGPSMRKERPPALCLF